jgi:uncharacterized protein YndB with AHSA1/START domain
MPNRDAGRPEGQGAAAPKFSDEAVRSKTGRTWSEWLSLLDAAGASGMSHKEIVAAVADLGGASPWWQQSVAVTYEQVRGLRQVHQAGATYQMSKSKTVAVPVAQLFEAWRDDWIRASWLGRPLEIRKETPNKSLRITWLEDGSHVDVGFAEKGAGRSQVSFQHTKLPDADTVERFKVLWGEALERLKETLENSHLQGS